MSGANAAVCFVGGAGHSGSTLLGLVLGAHPSVFYAGEANKSRFLATKERSFVSARARYAARAAACGRR